MHLANDITGYKDFLGPGIFGRSPSILPKAKKLIMAMEQFYHVSFIPLPAKSSEMQEKPRLMDKQWRSFGANAPMKPMYASNC
ncbi:hypothetical protein BGZ83_008626 [Gryganskiella cystojenkinii]|nr:hypothetical protein BGZ83_008626 [Gryganskiella cystojenkinii]